MWMHVCVHGGALCAHVGAHVHACVGIGFSALSINNIVENK